MFQNKLHKSSLSFVIALFLSLGMILPAQAASQPVITQLDVLSGRRVQVQIDNLPADTDFTVTEGPAGSQGIGHLIAHFNSYTGGSRIYWFEVLSDISGDATIDIRIDSGTGIVAYATVVNTGTFTAPTAVPVTYVQASTSSTSIPGQPVSTTGQISIVKVEQGGIVVVHLSGLPANTTFMVTLGVAGSFGIGGFKVAQLSTSGSLFETTATFEIPAPLRFTDVLDLRLDSDEAAYVIEFNNLDLNV